MNRQELLAAFLATLEDARVTRGERSALRALLAEGDLSESQRLALQNDLIDAVRDRLIDPRDKQMLDGLGQALNLLRPTEVARESSRALFGPEDPMAATLVSILQGARKSMDIAVFTITDDRLREHIIAAHRRGVHVRILSDDDKAYDRGSDVFELRQLGIDVAFDQSPHHFHHKFAVVDDALVVTGSYNWTRSADKVNRENYLVSTDPELVHAFGEAFDRMWAELAGA